MKKNVVISLMLLNLSIATSCSYSMDPWQEVAMALFRNRPAIKQKLETDFQNIGNLNTDQIIRCSVEAENQCVRPYLINFFRMQFGKPQLDEFEEKRALKKAEELDGKGY